MISHFCSEGKYLVWRSVGLKGLTGYNNIIKISASPLRRTSAQSAGTGHWTLSSLIVRSLLWVLRLALGISGWAEIREIIILSDYLWRPATSPPLIRLSSIVTLLLSWWTGQSGKFSSFQTITQHSALAPVRVVSSNTEYWRKSFELVSVDFLC